MKYTQIIKFDFNMKTKIYTVGILKQGQMTECTMATTDLADAKRTAKKENKNVYEFADNKHFLRKIYRRHQVPTPAV